MNNPVTQAIDELGGVTKLAAVLGVTYQAVRKWERNGEPPVKRAKSIEAATGGRVTKERLCPDVWSDVHALFYSKKAVTTRHKRKNAIVRLC